jgi:hypothetical protein
VQKKIQKAVFWRLKGGHYGLKIGLRRNTNQKIASGNCLSISLVFLSRLLMAQHCITRKIEKTPPVACRGSYEFKIKIQFS